LYHKTVEAGKKLMVAAGGVNAVRALKNEFGSQLKQFMLRIHVDTLQEAEHILHVAND
jgi:hypothetical protein